MDKLNKWEGSYTVEAVFIMTISIFVILSICYAAMFMHDKAVILSYGHYQMDYDSQDGQSPNAEEVENGIKQSLDKRLFFVRIRNVFVKKQIFSRKATIEYTLSLSIPLLKRALTDGGGTAKFELEHDCFRPAGRMWDLVIWKERGGFSED